MVVNYARYTTLYMQKIHMQFIHIAAWTGNGNLTYRDCQSA